MSKVRSLTEFCIWGKAATLSVRSRRRRLRKVIFESSEKVPRKFGAVKHKRGGQRGVSPASEA
jgi:hypothetical protein